MNWTDLLTKEIANTYRATNGLVKLVKPDRMDWKPKDGSNWMTTGQLLHHLESACGACCKGFATGDWGMPADASMEDMLPPAEKMASSKGPQATLSALAADERVALEMVAKVGEKDLASVTVGAPWDPTPKPLGLQFLHMVGHLGTHRSQLFYYLKLQGEPVHTGHLYGM